MVYGLNMFIILLNDRCCFVAAYCCLDILARVSLEFEIQKGLYALLLKSISIIGSLFNLELTSDLSPFFEFSLCYHPMRMKQVLYNQSVCLNSEISKWHAQLDNHD